MATNHIKALLVEDNPSDVLMIKRTIESHTRFSTSITIADSLEMAKGILDASRDIDLVISDLNLPDSKGVTTVAELYKHLSSIACPIIVVTSDVDIEVIEDCIKAGAYTFLAKGSLNGNLEIAMATAKARKSVLEDNNLQLLKTVKQCFTL